VTREERLAFISKIAPWAQASQKKWGLPASVICAQAILESGWERSTLARKFNNYFGIKDVKFNEGYCEFATAEILNGKQKIIRARFEDFESPEESFDVHGRLIARSARYAPAMRVAGDPVKFAMALQDCGYSTHPSYANRLVKLMVDYQLTQYDVAAPVKTNGGTGR